MKESGLPDPDLKQKKKCDYGGSDNEGGLAGEEQRLVTPTVCFSLDS